MLPISLDLASLSVGAVVALVIISMVLTFGLRLLRQRDQGTREVLAQTKGLIDALTDEKGEPRISQQTDQAHDERLHRIEERQEEHGTMLRRSFKALHQLDQGQRDILDYLTSSLPSDRPPSPRRPIPSSIDDESLDRPSQV